MKKKLASAYVALFVVAAIVLVLFLPYFVTRDINATLIFWAITLGVIGACGLFLEALEVLEKK